MRHPATELLAHRAENFGMAERMVITLEAIGVDELHLLVVAIAEAAELQMTLRAASAAVSAAATGSSWPTHFDRDDLERSRGDSLDPASRDDPID